MNYLYGISYTQYIHMHIQYVYVFIVFLIHVPVYNFINLHVYTIYIYIYTPSYRLGLNAIVYVYICIDNSEDLHAPLYLICVYTHKCQWKLTSISIVAPKRSKSKFRLK